MYTPNTKFNLISSLKLSEITTATFSALHGDLRNANDERDRRQVDTRLCCYITIVILVDIYIYLQIDYPI